jgi:hypothetical protein
MLLQHKSQGAGAFTLIETFSSDQTEILRSVAEDETSTDIINAKHESIHSIAARMQSQQKLSSWIVQALLPPAEVEPEQLRTDGAFFRLLKRHLPDHLSWAAQMVTQEVVTKQSNEGDLSSG